MRASYCANAWICARRTTDRDLESPRQEKVNSSICARPTTHHDLVSVIPDEKRERERAHFSDIMFLELVAVVSVLRIFY